MVFCSLHLLAFNRAVVLVLIFWTSVRTVVVTFQQAPQSLVSCSTEESQVVLFSPRGVSVSSLRVWLRITRVHARLQATHTAMQNHHPKEHLYKVLVIGDLGVGKTSIIKRYVHQNFSPNYRATIGVDFALKVLNLNQETVRLQLWDIAGNFFFF